MYLGSAEEESFFLYVYFKCLRVEKCQDENIPYHVIIKLICSGYSQNRRDIGSSCHTVLSIETHLNAYLCST